MICNFRVQTSSVTRIGCCRLTANRVGACQLSRLPARSALQKAAPFEVSTGDPRPAFGEAKGRSAKSNRLLRCRKKRLLNVSLRGQCLTGFRPHPFRQCALRTAFSPAGSVGASACGRGLHRRPAPLCTNKSRPKRSGFCCVCILKCTGNLILRLPPSRLQ